MTIFVCKSCFNSGDFGFTWRQFSASGTCDKCQSRFTKVMKVEESTNQEPEPEQLGFEGLE